MHHLYDRTGGRDDGTRDGKTEKEEGIPLLDENKHVSCKRRPGISAPASSKKGLRLKPRREKDRQKKKDGREAKPGLSSSAELA